MNFFSRHKNVMILAVVLLAQLLALAVQIRRQTDEGSVRLIRFAVVKALAPFERAMIHAGTGLRGVWNNYLDLRHVSAENNDLRRQLNDLHLQRDREQEDARQARRIQALLDFKENWIDKTVAAQIIGTSGVENAHLLTLDKGAADGIKPDMAVITPDGAAGKILNVVGEHVSQMLLINDQTSGLGATLVKSRLQGIVKGTPEGQVTLNYIMGDENVQAGEAIITSGGDHVFPRGLPVGTVTKVGMGRNLFLDIQVKPAVQLNRLEEVLIVTEQKPREPDVTGLGPIRAIDLVSQRLPGLPQSTPAEGAPAPNSASQNGVPPNAATPKTATPGAKPPSVTPQVAKPQSAVPQNNPPRRTAPPVVPAANAAPHPAGGAR
ncbi:MAG: rod shape-determining protein MreC [Acidobacteriota bacterium]|nr:rod shape-determining protein MreC [Acidobacteriota bacterium]